MNIKNSILLFTLALTIPFGSCNEEDGPGDDSNFDRELLLEELGNNIIVPSYIDYQDGVTDLKQRAIEFTLTPNQQTLQTLRDQFRITYLLWQECSFFEFGPASEVGLKSSTNSFPTDPVNIELNISSGSYNLEAPINKTSIGFPAIDYLIYNPSKSDNEIIISFVDENSRVQYLTDLVNQMMEKIDYVVEGWIPNGGNYIDQFRVKSGKESGSSLSDLLNEYNRHFENNTIERKIRTPLGNVLPESVEAYYSQESIPYAYANLNAMKMLFLGNFNGNSGLGIDDWLDAAGARYESTLLSNAILARFDTAIQRIDEIPDPYSSALIQAPQDAELALSELEILSELLKTEMTNALGITITYDKN
jgi:predicted lipoprotein